MARFVNDQAVLRRGDGPFRPFGGAPTLRGLLFSASEPGFTFEPWDITTLFQDRAGTTPVTAAGQSVGLRLDKSKGLVLGPELVTNGDFATDTGWTLGGNWSISGGTLNGAAATSYSHIQAIGLNPSKTYRLLVSVTVSIGSVAINLGGINEVAFTSSGQKTATLLLDPSAIPFVYVSGSNFTGTIDNISVRELAGNHEVAISDAKRGVYGWMPKTGRRNLLNATDTLSTQSVTVTAVAHTLAFTGTGTVTLSGASTAGPLVGTGASNRVTLTFTPTAGSLTLTVSGSVTLAQLQLGAADTAYQRVVSQYEITEAGVPTCYYVQADGVDDAYVTPTITPNTDKVQVFAGVRKLSDATTIFAELSASLNSNNGTFYVVSGINPLDGLHFSSKGTISSLASFSTGSVFSAVVSGLGDISGDTATLRINGTQVAQSTADQGTGNFLAYPAYIYGRAGTSLPFNGLDFGHAVRFGPNLDAATITRVEALIARNTPEVDFLFGGVWTDQYNWDDETNWNDGV